MVRILQALAAALVLAVCASVPVAQAAGPSDSAVVADLDGVPISVDDIPKYYCTDSDFPAIHCFDSARAMAAARVADGATARSATAVTYVTVYSQTSYGGSYLAISQDYDTLALVGWNDRIRSFRAQNAELGRFWTDWFASGSALDFCCNTWSPSLSATFDQKITSVYRR